MWSGYTNEVEAFIKSCGKCYCQNYIKSIESKHIIIKTYGPHIRYQADILYLSENLKRGTNYLYVLDLIDHFSKWEYSFLLKNKECKLVVSKIKAFIGMNENLFFSILIMVKNLII